MDLGLAFIDKLIIVGFFVLVVVVGMMMSKVASQGVDNYFLGGRSIPWWVLGASGTASNFDMTGTMVIVSMIYVLGLNGFWVEMRGGVGLPLAFLMVFLGKWLRRSKVMTEAEWMTFRFGKGKQGDSARLFTAISMLVLSVGMVIYFSVGTGVFLNQFLGLPIAVCSLIMVSIGVAYTLSAGFYGVVFTDIIQEILLIIVAIYISVVAFFMVGNGEISLPARFTEFSLPFTIDTTQPGLEPLIGYEMFTFCVVFWVLKGILEGMGGIGGYMSQRYYAARNEKEAGLMSAEWIVLLTVRWTMIMGLAVMALKYSAEIGGNPETALPVVLKYGLPTGLKGMALAGLLAAAMSTFDSTLNAGASYFVKDIYQPFIKKGQATNKESMRASKLASLAIAGVGLLISLVIPNINAIWGFITGQLMAALLIPLVLRWYWSRFNGYGYAIGTAVGLVFAIGMGIYDLQIAKIPLYISFPTISSVTLLCCIVATLMTEAPDEKVLKAFYLKSRPGGFWANIKEKVNPKERMSIIIEHLNDIIAVCLAVPAQLCLFFAAMAFVLHDWFKFSFCMAVVTICSIGLYFFWFKNLRSPEETGEAEEERQELAALQAAQEKEWKIATGQLDPAQLPEA